MVTKILQTQKLSIRQGEADMIPISDIVSKKVQLVKRKKKKELYTTHIGIVSTVYIVIVIMVVTTTVTKYPGRTKDFIES